MGELAHRIDLVPVEPTGGGTVELTEMDVRLIRHWSKCGHSGARLALAFGVTPSAISLILSGKRWAQVGDGQS